MMRLSPLSGYHAAEHMTVHAIEAGEALEPDIVSRMPRVHPRCGTNLLAAAGVFTILTTNFSSQITVLTALLVMVLGWRSIGAMLQTFATTKKPSRKQLENGIAAGMELLDKYQEQPTYQLVGIQRILKMGFIQTFAGMMTVMLILSYLANYIPLLKLLQF